MSSLPNAAGPFGRTGSAPRRHGQRTVVIVAGVILLAIELTMFHNLMPVRPLAGAAEIASVAVFAPARGGSPEPKGAAVRPAGLNEAPRPAPFPSLEGISEAVGSRPAPAASPAEPLTVRASLPPVQPGAPVFPEAEPAIFSETGGFHIAAALPELPSAVAAPAVPAMPNILRYASDADEAALALSRADRRALQRRLRLVGHDPRGADGIFGPATRAAIASWQTEAGLPASGFLDTAAYEALLARSERPYRRWQAAVAAERRAAQTRQIAEAAAGAFRDAPGSQACERHSDGRVISRQGLLCDLTGMGEELVTIVKTLGTL